MNVTRSKCYKMCVSCERPLARAATIIWFTLNVSCACSYSLFYQTLFPCCQTPGTTQLGLNNIGMCHGLVAAPFSCLWVLGGAFGSSSPCSCCSGKYFRQAWCVRLLPSLSAFCRYICHKQCVTQLCYIMHMLFGTCCDMPAVFHSGFMCAAFVLCFHTPVVLHQVWSHSCS